MEIHFNGVGSACETLVIAEKELYRVREDMRLILPTLGDMPGIDDIKEDIRKIMNKLEEENVIAKKMADVLDKSALTYVLGENRICDCVDDCKTQYNKRLPFNVKIANVRKYYNGVIS